MGYVGGTKQRDTKRSFLLSVTFALGMAVTYTALGVIASTLGGLIVAASGWWYIVLGVLMALLALHTYGLFIFIPSTYLVS